MSVEVQLPGLSAFQSAGAAPTVISGMLTFTGAAGFGATGTAINIFTGATKLLPVELYSLYVGIHTDLVDAVDGAEFTIEVVGNSAVFVDTAAFDLDLLDANDWLSDNDGTHSVSAGKNLVGEPVGVSTGAGSVLVAANITLTPKTQNITGGAMMFIASYSPAVPGAALARGANLTAIS